LFATGTYSCTTPTPALNRNANSSPNPNRDSSPAVIGYWNLQLQAVQLDDAGVYRCTVNTKPIGIKVVSLHVNGMDQ